MTERPDKQHRYRVNTPEGVRYATEAEKDAILDDVFEELPDEGAAPHLSSYPYNGE